MAKKASNNKKRKASNKSDRMVKFGLVIVIAAFVFIIYKIFDVAILSQERVDLSGQTYYQYFYGIREEYSGKMQVVQKDDEIKLLLENDKVIYLDSTPMYYNDILGQVLFAKPMEIVFPDVGSYKLDQFTNIIQENNTMYAKKVNKKDRKALNNAFLFDGNDLYFFLEETTIIVGDEEYIVSPLSYAIVNYRESVEIYNYDKDEYTIIQDENTLKTDVIAKNLPRNYTINMSVDSLSTEKRNQLLITSINNLNSFEYK